MTTPRITEVERYDPTTMELERVSGHLADALNALDSAQHGDLLPAHEAALADAVRIIEAACAIVDTVFTARTAPDRTEWDSPFCP